MKMQSHQGRLAENGAVRGWYRRIRHPSQDTSEALVVDLCHIMHTGLNSIFLLFFPGQCSQSMTSFLVDTPHVKYSMQRAVSFTLYSASIAIYAE